jgi:hypothetical protein
MKIIVMSEIRPKDKHETKQVQLELDEIKLLADLLVEYLSMCQETLANYDTADRHDPEMSAAIQDHASQQMGQAESILTRLKRHLPEGTIMP